jgi:hypothetical protein
MTAPRNEARPPQSAPDVGEELKRIPYEPLLPVEVKLVVWSLVLGIGLLGVLLWVSNTFFN